MMPAMCSSESEMKGLYSSGWVRICCAVARACGLVVGGRSELLAKVELVGDGSVETMTVGSDFVHGETERRAHGSDTLALDLCFVGLVGAELDFFLGLATHFCDLGGFTILLTAVQMCKESVTS